MKFSMPQLILSVVIAANATNLASMIERNQVLASDVFWDAASITPLLASSFIIMLLTTLRIKIYSRADWVWEF